MEVCDFIVTLNRLKKSSSEAIDNINEFDNFKEYMHVERNVESDLKDVLRRVNEYKKKTLVMLCGSAGDGKSHLMSYLKHSDSEKLMEDYKVYNDATEVWSQDKNTNETLDIILDSFSDEKLGLPGENVILAINLGVLSNFVESPYGKSRFHRLKDYVEERGILDSKVNESQVDEASQFQYVSFADYQLFSLDEHGVSPDFMESLLDKIFAEDEENVFYKKYKKKSLECTIAAKCPVKNNFEFFLDKKNRKYIAHLLVKGILKDKEIITTREILNYIYDILISPDFSYEKFCNYTDTYSYLKDYIRSTTPMLMFDNEDVTPLMNQLHKYDPLLERSEHADNLAVQYNVSSKVGEEIQQYLTNASYKKILANERYIENIVSDRELKLQFFKLLVRTKAITEYEEKDETYKFFLRDLYYYNAGKKNKLQDLYNMVQCAVINWCGSGPEKYICLDDKQPGLSIYENLEFEADLGNLPKQSDGTKLQKFIPNIIIGFINTKTNERIELGIDYSLYELVLKLKKGYIQTADDRNSHADFISFVEKILKAGSLDKRILVVLEDGMKATVEKNSFGYKFKVVS